MVLYDRDPFGDELLNLVHWGSVVIAQYLKGHLEKMVWPSFPVLEIYSYI